MDSIEVIGIRAYGYTGYLPEEQVLGQWFEVDLVLWLDLTSAGKSDNIDETLDYRQAIDLVKQQITTAKFALIEKLAATIAEEILRIKKVEKVQVKLSKLAAPIPDFGGKITISITKTKE
ncbi:MAG: dihydroneopterin aldolase [Xenococcaceae cyanobacterium MO_188.B29]|nr:dihydroneopterin aldolase [Xenococcaceae cyanobacterium MO_188.B29]